MNEEDKEYVFESTRQEGFDYCFWGWSSFEEIKDERFHDLRKSYLAARQELLDYITPEEDK